MSIRSTLVAAWLALAAPASAQVFHFNPQNERVYLLTPPVADVFAARVVAAGVGGTLVGVNDADEQEFLLRAFGTVEPLWIGLTDEVAEGAFVWDNGDPVTFTSWGSLEPDNAGGQQHWVALNAGGPGEWSDVEFDAASVGVRRGIVEIAAARSSVNDHVYLLTGTVPDVFAARDQARALGGRLVTINDAAEAMFLAQEFGTTDRYWIGLSDEATEGTFVWDSGQAVGYVDWLTGQPNNTAGLEHWVCMNFDASGRWNDTQSSATLSGVQRGLVEIAPRATETCAVSILTAPNFGSCPSNVNTYAASLLDLASNSGAGGLSLCAGTQIAVRLGVTVVDGEGIDFAISENTSATTEQYDVYVSRTGATWTKIAGPFSGGHWAADAGIDIAGSGVDEVEYVRLVSFTTQTSTAPGPELTQIVPIHYRAPLFFGEERPYADNLVEQFGTVDGAAILGAPNAHRVETYNGSFVGSEVGYAILPVGAEVTLAFTDHVVIDGPGYDLIVHEYGTPEGDSVVVEASQDGKTWVPAALVGSVSPTYGQVAIETTNVLGYDLAGSGLAWAEMVRLVAVVDGGDVDAVEAVHFERRPRAGSNDDCAQGTTLNGLGSPESVVKLASAGDFLAIDVKSPGFGLVGGSPIILGQLTPIGTVIPESMTDESIHVSAQVPGVIVLFNGLPSSVIGPTLLTPTGLSVGYVIPPGLSGLRLRIQTLIASFSAANGIYAATDAHDVIFQ